MTGLAIVDDIYAARSQGRGESGVRPLVIVTQPQQTDAARLDDLTSSSEAQRPNTDWRQLNAERRFRLESLNPQAPVYQAQGIARGYRTATRFRLHDVSLELRPGEITGVVGGNGHGKTTLLRIIAGELVPDEGILAYPALEVATPSGRRDWQRIRREIGFVRQRPDWWPGRLEQTLHHAASESGLPPEESRQRVAWTVLRLGLERHLESRWGELSGGFHMRAALARALVTGPKLLVLDEPLAALDVITQDRFLSDLRALANAVSRPLAVVIGSQRLFELETAADRMVLLRDGRPVFCDKVEALGKSRSSNTFELACDASADRVGEILSRPGVTCKQTASAGLTIQAPRSMTAQDVLRPLLDAGVAITYFRDVSRSTRTLFDAPGEEST
jgi:ABC-2 type transport system ATP-binding protein